MAGDWMPIRLDLVDDPDVLNIAAEVRSRGLFDEIDSDLIVGKLCRVLAWANRHTATGDIFGMTFAALDRIAGIEGLACGMNKVGWLRKTDTGIVFEKWDEWNSNSAKSRLLSAQRMRKSREDKKLTAQQNCNTGATKAQPKKRRGEKSTGEKKGKENAGAFSPSVLEIYNLYPRKVGKKAALTMIAKAIKDLNRPDAVEYLKARVQEYAESRKGEDQKYTPYPATWFNQERYDDDPGTWRHQSGPGTRPAGPAKARSEADRGLYAEDLPDAQLL